MRFVDRRRRAYTCPSAWERDPEERPPPLVTVGEELPVRQRPTLSLYSSDVGSPARCKTRRLPEKRREPAKRVRAEFVADDPATHIAMGAVRLLVRREPRPASTRHPSSKADLEEGGTRCGSRHCSLVSREKGDGVA